MKKNRENKWFIYKILSFKFRTFYSTIIVAYLIASLIIWIVEPGIDNLGDAFWFSFVAMTTIGFGDIYVVTVIGRITCAILSIMAIFIVALTTGVIATFYGDIVKMRNKEAVKNNEGIYKMVEDLKRLPDLSQEELATISSQITKHENLIKVYIKNNVE